jgi:hypothetical protein
MTTAAPARPGNAATAGPLTILAALAASAFPTATLAQTFSCTWNNTAGGSWTTAGNWTACNSTAPNNAGGNTYDAVIGVEGPYTVTLTSPVTIGTLTFDAFGATLANSSTLTTSGGVVLQTGTLSGGTITNSTSGGAAVSLSGSEAFGTLNGVTLNGALDVTGGNANAFISGSLTVNTNSGGSPGVINITGQGASLTVQQTTTSLNNMTINMGSAAGGATSVTVGYTTAGTLTLGAGVNVLSSGPSGPDAEDWLQQLDNTVTIVNNGTISVGTTGTVSGGGHSLIIDPANFTNNGSLTANAGSTLNVEPNTPSTLTNSGTGTISGANGSTVTLNGALNNAGSITMNGTGGTTTLQLGTAQTTAVSPATNWTNTGTITATNTAVLLGGSFTTAAVGTITQSGTTTVALNGFLTNTSATLNIASGSLAGLTMQGGTVLGGTITGGPTSNLYTANQSSGTLNGVTLNGPLSLTGAAANAIISDGLTVNTTSGGSPGVINITGEDAALSVEPSTTSLNNVTINMGNAAGGTTSLIAGYTGTTETLTFGANAHLISSGPSGSGVPNSGADILNQGSAATIVNNGTMSVSTTGTLSGGGHSLIIEPDTFTNNGSLTANAGSTLNIEPTTFTNSSTGTISGANGSTVTLSGAVSNAGSITMNGTGGTTTLQLGSLYTTSASPATNWTNTGTITAANTTVLLGGSFTTAAVGTITQSGTTTVALNGFLTNTSATLNIASGSLAGLTMQGGTILGGTITGGSSNLYTANASSGTLNGVTLNGSLDLTGEAANAIISDGLTVHTTSGGSPGVINITGGDASLFVAPTTTSLNNVTINMGNATGGSTSLTAGYSGAGTLSLGAGVNLLSSGRSGGQDVVGQSSAATIVNNGTMSVSTTGTVSGGGHILVIEPGTFTNNGNLTANANSTLNVEPTTFTNLASGTLTGGTYSVGAGGTMTIYNGTNPALSTLAANVQLSGAGSTVQTYNTSAAVYTPLESSLTTITAAGSLGVLGGRNYTTTNAIITAGTLQLGGGAFTAASLASSGTLAGSGTIAAPVTVNAGTITPGSLTTPGTLNITGTYTQSGGAFNELIGSTASYGVLNVSGGVSLASAAAALNITLASGFTPAAGDTFALLTTASSIAGAFNHPGSFVLDNYNWTLSYPGSDEALLTIVSAVSSGPSPANPVINNPLIDLGATRVGGAALSGAVSLTNQATTAPQAALDASITGTAPVSASGTVSLLAPGNTDSTHLVVGIGSGTSGAISGTATLALVSDASNVGGCGSNCQTTLPSQTVTVTGNVYQPALAQLNTTAPLFTGDNIVHVGQSVTQMISVTNAASGALNDVLLASASSAPTGYTAAGTLGTAGLAAGSTNSTSLSVSVNTATAGVLSGGTASFALASHDPQLPDLALSPLQVTVAGVTVNNYANPVFALNSGAGGLSNSGTAYTLNLGNVQLDAAAVSSLLSVLNQTTGPSDLLKGSFTAGSAPAGLTLTGFTAFSGLNAGQSASGLSVALDPTTLGEFTDTIDLTAEGYNASGYIEPFELTLTVEGDVTKVPEPGTLPLSALAGALLLLLGARRRVGMQAAPPPR